MVSPEERIRAARERVVVQATQPGIALVGRQISWSGVWSGFLVAVGTLVLLTALGVAIGATVADVSPGSASNPQGWGIGAGVWGFVSVAVALFLGGMVAGRFGAVPIVGSGATGAVEGMLVWVLAMLTVIVLGGQPLVRVVSGIVLAGVFLVYLDLFLLQSPRAWVAIGRASTNPIATIAPTTAR